MKTLKQKLQFVFLFTIFLIMAFTPLGSIPIGPIVATTAMIPIIITSFIFGVKIGCIFGILCSTVVLIIWTFVPPNPAIAFLFTPFYETAGISGNIFSIINVYLPKTLTGVVPAIVYNTMSKRFTKKQLLIVGSFLGSMTNTILTMLIILLFFSEPYSNLMNAPIFNLVGLTISTNGVLEGILCVCICPLTTYVLEKIK